MTRDFIVLFSPCSIITETYKKLPWIVGIFLIHLNLSYTASFAQTDPAANFKAKVVPPSPEAASLGRYGEYPVSLNNGLVNISIPLYEINTGKLSLPISLSYHAGGVKAYDVASSVGLGWVLNAGGVVSRSIMGAPDESSVGILNKPFPSPNDPGEHFTCFLFSLSKSILPFDGQSDIFSYNLGGSSGKFVFKNVRAIGTPWEIVTIPYSPVKINVSPDFQTFTIVDLDGTTYIFDEAERTIVNANGSFHSDGPTSWYLTSIISADKSDTITFTYTEPVQVTSVQASNTLSEREDGSVSLTSRVTLSQSATVSLHFSISIQDINFNNGKVSFEYVSDREDTSPNRLASIKIFQKNNGEYNEIKRFNLIQNYFTASSGQMSQIYFSSAPQPLDKRLRLDGLIEQGILNDVPLITKPPYTFEYETGAFPLLGSTAQDFMGFYNGAHSNENLLFYGIGNSGSGPTISQEFGANRQVNPDFTKAGSLKKITFPTGGYTLFETEPNKVNYPQSTEYTGGLRIKSITSNDGNGNTVKKKYSYTKWYYNSNLFNGDVAQMANNFKSRNKRYHQPGTGSGSIYWYNNYGENITFQLGSSSNAVLSYEEVEEFSVDGDDNPLGKTVSTFNKALDNIPSLAPYFRSDEEWKRSQLASQKIFKTNGSNQFVLLKEVINEYDYVVIDVVKNYSANLFFEAPSGIITNFFKECQGCDIHNEFQWIDFDQSVFKSNLISTTNIQYDENGSNPTSSKIDYQYDNPKHQQLTRTTQETSTSKVLVKNIKYPLDFSLANCDLDICYDNYNDALTDLIAAKRDCETPFYSQYMSYPDPNSAGAVTAFNNYMECTTFYHNQVVQTVLPNFNSCRTTFAGCINTAIASANDRDKSLLIMQRDNVINRVVENTSGFMLDEIEYITSGDRTDFKPAANGTTVPHIIWGFNAANLTTRSDVDLNPSSYYRKIGTFMKYDNSNNILQKAKENDVISSYIWGYNNTLPIAEIQNTDITTTTSSYSATNSVNYDVTDIGSLVPVSVPFEVFTNQNVTPTLTVSVIGTMQPPHPFLILTLKKADGAVAKTHSCTWGTNTVGSISLTPGVYQWYYSSILTLGDGFNGDHISMTTNYTGQVTGHNAFHTSFEDIGTTNADAKAGKKVWSGNYPLSLPGSNGNYKLSYWKKTGSAPWTLIEQTVTVTSGTTQTMNIGDGSSIIDEVRLFPPGAIMTTYTYDPLIGITSMTDPNNNISYYEYDASGRLELIRDPDRNIIKHYKYHYQGQE